MNLRQLQTEAHAIAVAKGWYDNEPTFGDRISLIHSELSEALEAYRERGLESWIQMGWANYANTIPDDKPEGVASELADVVIRVADMAEHYGVWVDAAYQRVSVRAYPIPQLETFGEWVTYINSWASKATSEYRQARAEGEDDIPYRADAIGEVIRGVVCMGAHYGIDLDGAIAAKMKHLREGTRC